MNNKINSSKRVKNKKRKINYIFPGALIILFTLFLTCNSTDFNKDNSLQVMDAQRFNELNDYTPFKVVKIKPETSPTLKLAAQACAGLYNRERGGSVYTHMTHKDSQWLEELNWEPEETLDALGLNFVSEEFLKRGTLTEEEDAPSHETRTEKEKK